MERQVGGKNEFLAYRKYMLLGPSLCYMSDQRPVIQKHISVSLQSGDALL